MSQFCPVCKSLLSFEKGKKFCKRCSRTTEKTKDSEDEEIQPVSKTKKSIVKSLELTLEVDFTKYGIEDGVTKQYDVVFTKRGWDVLDSGKDINNYVKCSSAKDTLYIEINYFIDVVENLGIGYLNSRLLGKIVEDSKINPTFFVPDNIGIVLKKLKNYNETFKKYDKGLSIGKDLKDRLE